MNYNLGFIFWFMLLGHLSGDFIFQNDLMALNKKKNTAKGYWCCLLHCLVYTLCVSVFTGLVLPLKFVTSMRFIYFINIVMWPHFFIDKYNIVSYWCKLYGKSLPWDKTKTKDKGWDKVSISFMSLVYIVIDNTLHLILMTLGLLLLIAHQ